MFMGPGSQGSQPKTSRFPGSPNVRDDTFSGDLPSKEDEAMTINPGDTVETARELAEAPAEFRDAVRKIVISHEVNDLYGAPVFDEPAIALAPTPYPQCLTLRVAMDDR